MTAVNELAPCKHCGSPVELHVGHQELMFFYCTNDDCYAITSFRATPELGKRKAIERWNRRAQPAEDDAEYTQGFAYDGVVILKDGQPITIDEVLAMLNARSGMVDELANFIRSIDGSNTLGAGALAEQICEFLARARGGQAG